MASAAQPTAELRPTGSESRDVVGSLEYARTRPDTRDMVIGLFTRCMGGVSTFAAMTRFPEAFEGVRCLVSPSSSPPTCCAISPTTEQDRQRGMWARSTGSCSGVYGVPEQWPHIRALYKRAGFVHTGHTEIVYLARVGDLPRPASPPIEGLSVRRSVGMNGTRLSAVLGDAVIGYVEVETLDEGERLSRHGGWADIGNLRVTGQYRRQGVATWLLGQAADWLQLAQVERSWATPGWRATIRWAATMRTPARSFRQSGSGN